MIKIFNTRPGRLTISPVTHHGSAELRITAQTRAGEATLPVHILANEAERIASAVWEDESLTVKGTGGSVSVAPARSGSEVSVASANGTVTLTLTGRTLTDFTRWMTGE